MMPLPSSCLCTCHLFPGVSHVAACCDKPPITQEEWESIFRRFKPWLTKVVRDTPDIDVWEED